MIVHVQHKKIPNIRSAQEITTFYYHKAGNFKTVVKPI